MARIDKFMTGLVLVLALVFSYAGGFWVAYPIIFVSIFFALRFGLSRDFRLFVRDRAVMSLLCAFLLLAIAFSITAKSAGDAAHIFDFTMFLLFGPLYIAFARQSSPQNAVKVVTLALLGSFLATMLALYQVLYLGMSRAEGIGSDPIWSAQAAIVIGFLALPGVSIIRSWWRYLFVLGPFLALFTTMLSGSRGPLLAFPVLVALYIAVGTKDWRRTGLSLLVVTVAFVGLSSLVQPKIFLRVSALPGIARDLFIGGQFADASAGERKLMYEAAFEAFKGAPLFGYGWTKKVEAVAPYLPKDFAQVSGIHHHLHNDILDFMVSGGIFGLISYILVIAAPIVGSIWSPDDSLYRFRVLFSLIISFSYLMNGLTYLMFGYEFHTTLFVCLTAVVLGFCRDENPFKPVQAIGPSSAR